METDVMAKRMARFSALCSKYWIPLLPEGPWDDSSAEDAASVLNGETPLRRWASVTAGGDPIHHYIKTFDTQAEATAASVEYLDNDIFVEGPVALCDLDAESEPWGQLYLLHSLTPHYRPAY